MFVVLHIFMLDFVSLFALFGLICSLHCSLVVAFEFTPISRQRNRRCLADCLQHQCTM